MNISSLCNRTITGIKKINQNFCSNPTRLRELAQDTFTSTQKTAKKLNPNTGFLRNPNLSHKEKMAILKNNPFIFRATELTTQTGAPSSAWLKERFFNIEYYTNVYSTGKQAPTIKIIDITDPTNAKSLEYLKSVSQGAVDGEGFRLLTKMDAETYRRYCREGLIEKIQLPHKETGALTNTGLINPNSPKNIAAAERFKALTPKNSSFYGQRYISVGDLSKLGFGSPKELVGLIKSGVIDGTIKVIGKNEKGQNIIQATVDTASGKTKLNLKSLREKRCIEIGDLAARSGIKQKQLEDAILAGEMETVERLFAFDSKNPILDTANPINVATFDKMQFERKLQREALKAKATARHEEMSLKTKLAWHFCPKTRAAASIAFAQSDIKVIQGQIASLKSLLDNPKLTPEEVETLEEQLSILYAKEDIELKKIFSSMWKSVGSEEYKTAITKAKEIIAQVRTSGIDSIQDECIAAILRAHQG